DGHISSYPSRRRLAAEVRRQDDAPRAVAAAQQQAVAIRVRSRAEDDVGRRFALLFLAGLEPRPGWLEADQSAVTLGDMLEGGACPALARVAVDEIVRLVPITSDDGVTEIQRGLFRAGIGGVGRGVPAAKEQKRQRRAGAVAGNGAHG